MAGEALPVGPDYALRSKGTTLPVHVLLLIAALAGTVVAQGGYYLPGRILAAALVAAALVVTRWSLADVRPVLFACSGIALWAVVRALMDGSVGTALPTVGSVFCLAGAVVVAQRNNAAERALLASVAVGIGTLVGLSGWIAVVWRIPSWTTVADGLVRAGSTLTYPNASAALLAALSVLSISQQMTRPRSLVQLTATYLLLVGLGATLSRAGVLAFVVGLVVLALLAGARSTALHVVAPGIGAVVADLMLPYPVTSTAQPWFAAIGLAVGLVIAVGLTRLPAVGKAAAGGLGLVGAVVALVLSADKLLHGRISFSSPDRAGVVGAALKVVATRPITGVGPGNAWFTWTGADGIGRVGRLVHNEYVQALVEFGAIGLLLVLGLLVAILVVVRRRPKESPTLWAGAIAGLIALLVHSGFDFLWHIPAVVLTAGLLVGLASSSAREKV